MPLTARDIEPAFKLWPQLQGAVARLLNYSENHTFGLTTPHSERYALRVHRHHYQSEASILSELSWLQAIRAHLGLPVPEPISGTDGQLLQRFTTPSGDQHYAVLFHHIDGDEPEPGADLSGIFTTLGAFAGQLHKHAASWEKPEGFERQVWEASSILDAEGLWGDWRKAPGVDGSVRPILNRLDAALRQHLRAYGTGADRYGLIHADMRLGNLLVNGDALSLIDFDDSGFCWYVYDFAAAISFHETHPSIPALKSSWLEGYARHRTLTVQDLGMIDAMIMLRRMALLAWIGSHNETKLAQTHEPGFAEATADLAERYLSGSIWP